VRGQTKLVSLQTSVYNSKSNLSAQPTDVKPKWMWFFTSQEDFGIIELSQFHPLRPSRRTVEQMGDEKYPDMQSYQGIMLWLTENSCEFDNVEYELAVSAHRLFCRCVK